MAEEKNILEIKNLKKYFKVGAGVLHAVDDVSFTIQEGTTLGVVGESGCGKSTLGRTILRLIEPTSGEIYFNGENITKVGRKKMKELRKDMQLIFQDPFSSLNPKLSISQAIDEALVLTGDYKNSEERFAKVLELMETVGLNCSQILCIPTPKRFFPHFRFQVSTTAGKEFSSKVKSHPQSTPSLAAALLLAANTAQSNALPVSLS